MRIHLFEIDSKYKPVINDIINHTLINTPETDLDKIELLKNMLQEINSSMDIPLPIESDVS